MKSRDTWSNRQAGLGVQNEAGQRLIEFLPREHTGHSKYPLPTTQREDSTHGHYQMVSTKIRLIILAVQGTLKSLLQHHNSKPSIRQHSAYFMVQISHLYMTTGKTIALTIHTFVGKVTSLLFNMLSTLVITFLPRGKCLLIS